MTDRELEFKIQQIKEGFRLWNRFVEKNRLVKEDYVLIFPHCGHPINNVGMKYLSRFIQIRKPHRIYILCQSEILYQEIKIRADLTQISIEQINKKEMENLLACYSTVNLAQHLIIMSLTEPAGRCGEKIIERKMSDIDKVVLFGIYGLSKEDVRDEL